MALKVWNGTAWTSASAIKVWNGTAWTSATAGKVWNGTAWVDFLGSPVSITDQSALNDSLGGIGGTATATYRLGNNGIARTTDGAGTLQNITGEWLISGAVSLYEAQATWQAGTGSTSGPVGWVSLATTRDWGLSATNNNVARDLFVEIRLASTGTVLDTATISFAVDSAP
jgi:hypothetical protein